MKKKTKTEISKVLKSLYFVRWDRYVPRSTASDFEDYVFYGWIDRDKDEKKDFMLLEYSDGMFYWVTSSAARDTEIGEIVDGYKGSGIACKRIEYDFKLPNVIKLNAAKKSTPKTKAKSV